MTTKTTTRTKVDDTDFVAISPPQIAEMTIWERIQKIREVVTYIKRTELSGGAPYKSAVSHDSLIEKVRPHLVTYHIAWHPIDIEIINQGEILTAAGKPQKWCQVKTVIRFYCTDKIPRPDRNEYGEYIDIPVISEGLDGQDKGSAKAMTYADKSALMWLLNLQRGDDPDFDRLAPGSGADDDITALVNQIRTLYENHPDFKDNPGAGVQGWLVRLARSRGRFRVPTMYDLTEDQLGHWIAELEAEAKQHGGTHGKQGADETGDGSHETGAA